MKLSIFCPFGLKTPNHAPKIGVWGVFHPKNGQQYQRNPYRAGATAQPVIFGTIAVNASVTSSPVAITRAGVWPCRRGVNSSPTAAAGLLLWARPAGAIDRLLCSAQ